MARPKSLLPDGAEAGLFFFEGQYQFVARNGRRDQVKYVGPEAVREAFTTERIDSGWLGPGIVRVGRTPSGPFAVAFVTAGRREITIAPADAESFVLRVPVPPLVAVGSGQGLHLFAVRPNEFDADAAVCYPPFPNLFADSRVCWGQNQSPPVDHTRILAAVDLYFSTPFNLNEAARRSRAFPANVADQLRRLERRRARTYPVDDLVAISPKATVRSVVDRIVSSDRGGHTWE